MWFVPPLETFDCLPKSFDCQRPSGLVRAPADVPIASYIRRRLLSIRRKVVNDPDLTLNEKRAILASWASDACAIEAAPGLRRVPGSKSPV
jgi:hypothetical protein